MRLSVSLTTLGLALALLGCEDKKTDQGDDQDRTEAAASATGAPSASAEAPIEARKNPDDLKVATVLKETGCAKGGKAKSKAVCEILEGFEQGEQWDGKTPSGKGIWVGWAYTLEKGQEKKERMIFQARTMPTAKVGPSDLPIMVGTGVMPDKLQHDWDKMLRLLGRGNRIKKRNLCSRHMEEFEPTIERGAIFTSGTSTQLIADEDVYIRKAGIKHLYYVELAMDRSAAPGDGKYAKLWMAVW